MKKLKKECSDTPFTDAMETVLIGLAWAWAAAIVIFTAVAW